MPTLLDFRRRIRSVRNTQQITRAMKFVAAARLRRAQERVFAARPYARQMLRVMGSAIARIENPTHPLMARRTEETVLVLVLSGDRGLCGAFNSNVLRRALEFLREHHSQEMEIIAVGKKGRDALRKQSLDFRQEYVNITQRVDLARAKEVAAQVISLYSRGEVDCVYAIYNEFKSILTQRLLVEKLLPIEPDILKVVEPGTATDASELRASLPRQPGTDGMLGVVDYIYEQPPEAIFARLLERHVETQVFRILLESSAAEHAARMTAMDSATNNAADLIDSLTLHMNKVRQAAITREIIEVVSGAASAAS